MTVPVSMISFEIDLARSTGMANPRPMLPPPASPEGLGTVAPAVGTPISCPSQLTSAPPLFPGLMAASVCTAETSSAWPPLSPGTWTVRSSALTMPEVTVLDRPSGAPSATTGWPTRTVSDDPSAITFRSRGGVMWSTARSVCGSRPVIVAGTAAPSEKSTLTEPPSAAIEITWLFVRMYPSARITSPEPFPPPPEALLALIVTTDGSTLFATDSTWHADSRLPPAPLPDELDDPAEQPAATATRPIAISPATTLRDAPGVTAASRLRPCPPA